MLRFLHKPSLPQLSTAAGAPAALHPAGQLMDDFDRGERRVLYGANELVIPVKSPLALMGEEMIHPFFIFQYASVTIWCGAGTCGGGSSRVLGWL